MKLYYSASLLALCFASPLQAQAWNTTPDTVTYGTTGLGVNVVGDGSTTQGGIAPAYENGSNPFEPGDIANNFTTSTYLNTNVSRLVPGSEAKFRTVCNFGFVGQFDFIVFPNQDKKGHLHMFFGNDSATYTSNYNSLRTTGESTCAGNKNNRSVYWVPAFMEDLSTGVAAVRKFNRAIVYYNVPDATEAQKKSRFPRNFKYIGGYDPADPNNTKMTGPIATANAIIGGVYQIPGANFGIGTSSGTGFEGWSCLATDQGTTVNGSNANSPVPGSAFQPYLRNAAGQSTLTCPTNGALVAVLHMPTCWSGKNLQSPLGRQHVAYEVRNNNTGQLTCPNGWYKLPEFELKLIWGLKGNEDVGKFYLSSDVMDYGAADPSSRSPCRKVSNHYCNGETFHNDWFGAWPYGTGSSPDIMMRWMINCNGIKIILNGVTIPGNPAECDSSTIDATNALVTTGTTSKGQPFGSPNVFYENQSNTIKYTLAPNTTGSAGHTHGGKPPTN